MLAPTCNSSTQEAEVGGLIAEFEDSLGYRVRQCLTKPKVNILGEITCFIFTLNYFWNL